jgi:hypothetical protein
MLRRMIELKTLPRSLRNETFDSKMSVHEFVYEYHIDVKTEGNNNFILFSKNQLQAIIISG